MRREPLSDFLYTLWTEECVRCVGHVLPITDITENSIGWTADDDDEPEFIDGEPTRTLRIRYERELFIDEEDIS